MEQNPSYRAGVALGIALDIMNVTAAPRLATAIRTHLAPCLGADGFAGSGSKYRRVVDGWVQVVSVQGARGGGSFAVNLALQPLAAPDILGNPPDQKRITEELCEFRRRLSEGGSDQWWKHDGTEGGMNAAALAAALVYVNVGRPLLARVSGPNAPLNAVTAEEFDKGAYDFSGFGSTKGRMALILARLRRSQGRANDSAAFARVGLSQLGSAVALRRELEQLAVTS
jgi:hypothetical protein